MASFEIGNPFWQFVVPEYELEGYWTCAIYDDESNNSVKVKMLMPLGFDKYVQTVSIPQLSLGYENNEYGLMSFKEKSAYDDVTITFYDDLKGSCLGFFSNWLRFIYDEKRNCLMPNWRYEAKDIVVSYYRALYGNVQTIKSYRMIKCLPKGISEVSTEEEVSGRKTFSVTLMTQRVENATNNYNVANLQNVFLNG